MGSKHLGADINLRLADRPDRGHGCPGRGQHPVPQGVGGRCEGRRSTRPCATFIAEYEDTLANPYVAAERGYIDTVISPSKTRMNVSKALRALRTKRESLPPKKHGNIPL
jgi:propionyl-CoA carboxylase beta chain